MKNKKWELLKHAYDNYPKGTKFLSIAHKEKCISNGIFYFGAIDKENILTEVDSIGRYVYIAGKWAEIIAEEKPKSILDGKVVIQVNNEREFKLLMEHFESKGWILNNGIKPTDQEFSGKCWVTYKNRSDFKYREEYLDITVIPFSEFAKEVSIEVPKFIMKSEDGVDLYEGDEYVYVLFAGGKWSISTSNFCGMYSYSFCIKERKTSKAFHSKENALKWIDEQNKPKEIKASLYFGHEVIINSYKSEIRIMDADKEVSTLSFGDIHDIQNAINKLI